MSLENSIKTGLGFGITSAVITTLGLIIGLSVGTSSKLTVIGGIFTIAIADAFSDALGIHISQEAEEHHTSKEVWKITFSAFLSKFLFALTFLVPILFLELTISVIIDIVWGLLLLTWFSYSIAKEQNNRKIKVIGEHVLIAIVVIIISYFSGRLISSLLQ